ncbi:unnamed protein product [Pleuronectes platessa]|uniref:Uncharacterized protein n=1 Tax=Pleuronectes platessa TaxID=8262 RepID=A0A9N7URN9_PLEPL|nr:unnamed protein product [Pleuronectes platessa]
MCVSPSAFPGARFVCAGSEEAEALIKEQACSTLAHGLRSTGFFLEPLPGFTLGFEGALTSSSSAECRFRQDSGIYLQRQGVWHRATLPLMAQRSLGNLGQLNLIPETEPGAADSGVRHIQRHPALSGQNDLEL